MKKKIFVLTAPEDGWDCVRGVYKAKNEEDVRRHLEEEKGKPWDQLEDHYIIHEQYEITEL